MKSLPTVCLLGGCTRVWRRATNRHAVQCATGRIGSEFTAWPPCSSFARCGWDAGAAALDRAGCLWSRTERAVGPPPLRGAPSVRRQNRQPTQKTSVPTKPTRSWGPTSHRVPSRPTASLADGPCPRAAEELIHLEAANTAAGLSPVRGPRAFRLLHPRSTARTQV